MVAGVWISSNGPDCVESSMAIIKATPHERMVLAVKRYRSFKTLESSCEIIKLYRKAYHPQQGGPTLQQMQKLGLLVIATILLMYDDKKHIQEILEVLEERKARNASSNHSTDLATEDLCKS